MITIVSILHTIFYMYKNPNIYTNNYKVKKYYHNSENDNKNNTITNSKLNYKLFTLNYIDYNKYNLFKLIISNINNNIVSRKGSNPAPF